MSPRERSVSTPARRPRRGVAVAVALCAALLAAGPATAARASSGETPAPPASSVAVPAGDDLRGEWAAEPSRWPLLAGAVARGEATPLGKAADGMTAAQRLEANLAAFDATVSDYFARSGQPGAAVGIVAGDRVIYARALGVKEAGRPDPVGLDTLFQIGSTSKAFTSVLLGTLVDQGIVNWTDKVQGWLPQFHLADDRDAQMDVEDVLSHRSGLPDHANLVLLETFMATRDEIVSRLPLLTPVAELRTEFQYQNTMVTVGGMVAEAATGKPYADLVADRIFAKVGMPHAAVTYAQTMAAPDKVSGHKGNVGGPYEPYPMYNLDADGPAGSLAVSVNEMLRWIRVHLNGGEIDGVRIVSETSLAATHTPHNLVPDDGITGTKGYGLCWVVQNMYGVRSWFHDGDSLTNGSLVYLLPNEGIGLVVLGNTQPQPLGYALAPVMQDLALLGTVRGDYYQPIADALGRPTEPGYPVLPADPPADAAPPGPLADYVGLYDDPYYGTIEVLDAGGSLEMVVGANPTPVPLGSWDGDVFIDLSTRAAVRFERAISGVPGLHWDFLEQTNWPVQDFQRAG